MTIEPTEKINFITRLLTTVLVCWIAAAVLGWLSHLALGGEVDCDYLFQAGNCASRDSVLVSDFLAYAALAMILMSVILPAIFVRRHNAEKRVTISTPD